MNQAHFEVLRRRLAAPARRPSELLAKAQAALQLSDAGVFTQASPEVCDRVRAVLEGLLIDCGEVGGWQADRAAGITGRVLDRLEQSDEPEDDRFGEWKDGDPFFELDLVYEMSRATGWRQGPIDPAVLRDSEAILASAVPTEVANAWMREHRIAEPVPAGGHYPLPDTPGQEGEFES